MLLLAEASSPAMLCGSVAGVRGSTNGVVPQPPRRGGLLRGGATWISSSLSSSSGAGEVGEGCAVGTGSSVSEEGTPKSSRARRSSTVSLRLTLGGRGLSASMGLPPSTSGSTCLVDCVTPSPVVTAAATSYVELAGPTSCRPLPKLSRPPAWRAVALHSRMCADERSADAKSASWLIRAQRCIKAESSKEHDQRVKRATKRCMYKTKSPVMNE